MSTLPRSRLFADSALVAITVLWGTTFVVVKDALEGAPPFTFLALRFGIGALAAALLAGRGLVHGPSVRAGLLLGPFLFAGFAFQTAGLAFTTPARSAFLTGLLVLFVPVASVAILRKPLRPATLAGAALAVAGLWLLTDPAANPGGSGLRGELLTLGCAVAYAVHLTLNERIARDTRPMALVAVQLAVVAALSAGASLFESRPVEWSGAFAGAVVFTGVVASALAIGVQAWALARTSAVRASLVFSLETPFAAAFSVMLGREVLGPAATLGGALMVAGVLVAELWPLVAARALAPAAEDAA